VLELYGPDGSLITTNDNWKDTQQAQVEASGVKPDRDSEAAIVATLQPGIYTAIVRGKNNTQGVALAEIYDLDRAADSKLANISTRGFVATGENVVIGGFLLGGSRETSDVVIRAIGPSLNQSGLASEKLADPTLELRDSNGTLVRKTTTGRKTQARRRRSRRTASLPRTPPNQQSSPPRPATTLRSSQE
jgi:hypothetical protein